MTRFARTFALLLLTLALSPSLLFAQPIQRTEDGLETTITKSFSVEPGGTLDLHATNGSVTVTGGSQNEVSIEETIRFQNASRSAAKEYLNTHPTRYEHTDNTVRVRGPDVDDDDSWFGDGEPDAQYQYEVTVPRRFNATVRTGGGSVEIRGLEGTVDGQTAGGSIGAKNIVGDVKVETAGGSVTLRSIDGTAQGNTAGGSIEADSVTGELQLETAGGSIAVSSAGARVDAETAGGSIKVDGAQGSVRANTSGGDVTVRGASGSVNAETSGGDIILEDIGGDATAETSGGDIEGRGLRGAVDAETSAGDIELRGVEGPVQAETSVGDIEVQSVATSYATDPAMDLTTSHGDIQLTVPASLQASIQAKVEDQMGGGDPDNIRSDVPLTREGGDGEPLRARGDMNGGGPGLRLETSGGSIQIRTSEN
ncbi:MAG: DUF4097 domain-containing protein [Salinibacter sp.]|uniref:DUF4097 domain-containing protein n=1 Tax=Salinibacter sp. TaxID=2065818 RepID=UPI0035D422FD